MYKLVATKAIKALEPPAHSGAQKTTLHLVSRCSDKAVAGQRLDAMSSKVLSKLSDSVLPWLCESLLCEM